MNVLWARIPDPCQCTGFDWSRYLRIGRRDVLRFTKENLITTSTFLKVQHEADHLVRTERRIQKIEKDVTPTFEF